MQFHKTQAANLLKKAQAAKTQSEADFFMKNAVRHADKAGTTVEAIEAELDASAPKPRCPHYDAIKEFFAVAREVGLDTSKEGKDRVRGAIGMLLGRRIESRSELTGAEWAFCTNAVRMGRLFW
jgi:hypothetical protein